MAVPQSFHMQRQQDWDTVTESEIGSDDNNWDDWCEDGEEGDASSYQCLFCSTNYTAVQPLLHHCVNDHGFDFRKIQKQRKLDFYGTIKLVNYIRKMVQENPAFNKVTDGDFDAIEAAGDDYLKPVLDGDALLYGLDDDDDEDFEESKHSEKAPEEVPSNKVSNDEITIQKLQAQLREAQNQLKTVENQFEGYRHMVRDTFFDDGSTKPNLSVTDHEDVGNYYFNSYAGNEIHEVMLKDKVRTDAYRDFMYDNKDLFKGKVVLDVGCGTGILSMFAAMSGASKVIAVDNSDIIEKARANVKENGLDHIITLVRGKVEEVELPVSTVDIIISEWMGYFLLYEAMLDSVLVARDKYLAPDGILGPSHSQILLTAIDDEDLINERFNFWNDVYGFKMSAMSDGTRSDAIVDFVNPDTTVTSVACLKTIDHHTTTVGSLDFNTKVTLKATRAGTVHAFVGYFDIQFVKSRESSDATRVLVQEGDEVELENGHAKGVPGTVVSFTTGPGGINTHWKQTLFILDHPFAVEEGSLIHVDFGCRKSTQNVRELKFRIKYSCGADIEGDETFWLR